MDSLIKLNTQTAGRDKIARLAQYLSRVLWYQLKQNEKQGVQGFQNLEYQLSTFRKLLRFGRCIDTLNAAVAVFQHSNPTVRVTITLSKISTALFLLADHILWLGRADLCNINTNRWGRIANKYWLYSIVMNLVRDFYEILQIIKMEKSRIIPKGGCANLNDVFKSAGRAFMCIQASPHVMADTIKNCCDVFIPLAGLGHVKLAPDTIGYLGAISSIAGLIALIYPVAKLTPV